jgi:transketolase N-terminal domain/subunit
VQQAKSGHPGAPMGMADIATVLFKEFIQFDAAEPHWIDRDRFIMSNGHGSMLLYSLLHLTGYKDMPIEELKRFRQVGSKTPGHPEYHHADGIELTTGPLGQGVAEAVGMALAERIMNAQFGDELVDHYTYVFMGDGCLMEGISQEAISLAGHLKLGRLIAFWDNNSISIDGATSLAVSDNEVARFGASGWHVQEIDGHDTDAIRAAIETARSATERPSMIACRTMAAMPRYKQLWSVEQTFRTAKHLLATRPIFHRLDETIRGHVFCSFLALVLKAELEARIAELGHTASWPAIIADLDALTETELEQDGRRFLLRAAPRPAASLAMRAAGVALPPTVQAVAEA